MIVVLAKALQLCNSEGFVTDSGEHEIYGEPQIYHRRKPRKKERGDTTVVTDNDFPVALAINPSEPETWDINHG